MKWVTYLEKCSLVVEDADLREARELIATATKLWAREYHDEGAVVIGSGVAVLHLPKRCRNPRVKVITNPPGQGDGQRSVRTPIRYLNMHGFPCFWECGRRD